jgi:L-threonylcarbamoyladenylate synthase
MKTIILSAQDPLSLPRAFEILSVGGLVAFPTDTVYGLGALAFNDAAVRSIFPAKDRPKEKAIPVLISDFEDLAKVSSEVSELASTLAGRFWPGALTLVVRKNPALPESVSEGPTVGVRIPDHPFARALLRLTGPMAVSSANLSGQPGPSTADQVFNQLGGRIAMILDGGRTPGGTPSTVVECLAAQPRILRAGPISLAEIMALSGHLD